MDLKVIVWKNGPRNTSVSVSPSGEIVEGSSVTLTCSGDANPPVDKYTWYKKNVASPKASGQSYNITNIISEDRGEYYCEAQNGRGSNNSTALMIIVAGKQTSVLTAAVGIIVVVLVLILCLSGLMWFRKKASKPTNTRDTADDGQGDSSPVYDNISNMAMTSTAAQTADTDNQDDVHYASVHFSHSKNQEVPLYSTVQLLQPQKEDEDVQYAAVNFNLPCAATRCLAALGLAGEVVVVVSGGWSRRRGTGRRSLQWLWVLPMSSHARGLAGAEYITAELDCSALPTDSGRRQPSNGSRPRNR
ncbi:B-cell receptor CD22-like [Oncorhynchus masou masou]|uniref:B-cell receptor CD22-like n=1 Tax=Oncorhynchus masou masou TaxID=90313 RepID=UPI00318306BF